MILSNQCRSLLTHFTGRVGLILLLLGGDLPAADLHGQSAAPVPYGYRPSRGHWQLHTHAASRSTTVNFYGADSPLLYQEQLPNGLIRLTERNGRRLDGLLHQLLHRQLVASAVQTTLLLPVSSPEPTQMQTGSRAASRAAGQVLVYPLRQQTAFRLVICNPASSRVQIRLFNGHQTSVYEEFTDRKQYHKTLNVLPLPAGPNTLQVAVRRRVMHPETIRVAPAGVASQVTGTSLIRKYSF
jgi:hypothetical protein